MKLRFDDVMKLYAAHDKEFDLCCGDVDCSYTFSFCGEPYFSDYCYEKYGKLLKAEAEIKLDTTGRYTDVVIVEDCDYELGERFAAAWAGYVSATEYEKLFEKEE